MGMLIARDGGHPPATGATLIDIPGVEGRIGADVQRKDAQDAHHLDGERHEVADVIFVEGLGVLGHDDGTVVGGGGGCHAGAIAPQVLFDDFLGAIGLLDVGTFLDARAGNRDHLWVGGLCSSGLSWRRVDCSL